MEPDFSTEVEAVGVSPLERLASDDFTASPLQGLNDLAYSIFFKIAPSLAGAVLAMCHAPAIRVLNQ